MVERLGDTSKDREYLPRPCLETNLEATVANTLDKTVGVIQVHATRWSRSTIKRPHGARVSSREPEL